MALLRATTLQEMGLVYARNERETDIPDGQHLTPRILLPPPPDSQPMASIVNRMRRIIRRLEYHPCLWPTLISTAISPAAITAPAITRIRTGGRALVDGHLPLVPVRVFFRVMRGRVGGGGRAARTGGAGGGFEFARALPFGTAREPEHEPVIGQVFFAEVGC